MGCNCNFKAVAVAILQTLIVIGVYGLTLHKFHVSYGSPVWMEEQLAPLYIFFAVVAGILVVMLIKFAVYRKFSNEMKWRPSVIAYLIVCAMPCSILLIVSHFLETTEEHDKVLLWGSFQAVVGGLLFTEWIAKFRSERVTYHLLEEATVDFFFAYDVIDFYDIYFRDGKANVDSAWLCVTAVFALIAMMKYGPVRPLSMEDPCSCDDACRCVYFSLCFNDIPFLIVRIVFVCMYGLEVMDIIHPAKNVVLILLGAMQIRQLKLNSQDCSQNCIRRCGRDKVLHPI